MNSVTPAFLKLDENQILFWKFDGLDASISPQQQASALKVDLAQLVLGHGVLLDVGWYPARDPSGGFVIQVVREGEWETPIVRLTASDWDALRDALSKAMVLAKVAELERKR